MSECQGGCSGHMHPVQLVQVCSAERNWGRFHYCQTAINADRANGLTVTPVEEDPRTVRHVHRRAAQLLYDYRSLPNVSAMGLCNQLRIEFGDQLFDEATKDPKVRSDM